MTGPRSQRLEERGEVRRAVLHMSWRLLTAIHWRVDPTRIAPLLPPGVEVDTFDGDGWIGLVPFEMRDVRLPGMPRGIPWLGTFPETNVRTYVRDRDGRTGVFFRSLDASRAGAVGIARAAYDLPYFWGHMRIERRDSATDRGGGGPGLRYRSFRRVPGPRGAMSRVEVVPGRAIDPDDLDLFLAERYALYVTARDGTARRAEVAHEPWPLHEAELTDLVDELTVAAGFGDVLSRSPDRVRFSPGVNVRVGLPRRLFGDDPLRAGALARRNAPRRE